MPKHFLYVMDSGAKAPAGDGDTRSWFEFYKWNVEGEVFVPRREPFFEGVVPGDFIWFAFLGWGSGGKRCAHVVGTSQITRVEDEHRMQEIWYRGDDVYTFEYAPEFDEQWVEVPTEVAEGWLMKATRSSP